MRFRPFGGGIFILHRPRVDYELSRRLLGVVTNIASDEPRALRIGGKFTIAFVLLGPATTSIPVMR